MGVDKKLEITYDLASLNEEQASKLINANKYVIKNAEKQKKKVNGKAKKTEGKEKKKKKDKQVKTKQYSQLKDLIKKAQNTKNSLFSTLKTSIPQLSAIIATTGIIIGLLKQINELQIKFVENVDKRINIGVSNVEQARIDANLQQVIITNGDGSINPRNVYNSFNESDAIKSSTESNNRLDNTSGYE